MYQCMRWNVLQLEILITSIQASIGTRYYPLLPDEGDKLSIKHIHWTILLALFKALGPKTHWGWATFFRHSRWTFGPLGYELMN